MAEGERSYDPAKDATAQEPLTSNEVRLVTRLFGDPFAFPLEFKAWLRGWLEEQYPRIGTLGTPADTGAAGAFVPPAGAILDYAGATAPGGYVLCDGAEYDRTSLVYSRLFTAIGTTYGTSGGNMFNVPDLRGRIVVGKGTHADVDALNDNDGQAVADRTPKHDHNGATGNDSPGTNSAGSHSHGGATGNAGTHDHVSGNASSSTSVSGPGAYGVAINSHNHVIDPAGDHAHSIGGDGGHSHTVNAHGHSIPTDGPSFIVVNKIISLGA
jgi:microcystin-dependent protein